jgi:predicted hydrocarbon binding protein
MAVMLHLYTNLKANSFKGFKSIFNTTEVQSPEAENAQSRRRWQDYGFIKEEVAKVLDGHPEGITGARIAELVGITQGAMSKYLSMLQVDGIITSRKVGVAKLWKLVSQSDRAGILADKIGEADEEATFKDYAVSILEENNRLFEADGKRVMVMPTSMLSNLYKYTKSIIGTEVHAFFYEWGKDYAREVNKLVDDVARKMHKSFIESFLLLWKLKGWGRFEIVSMQEDVIEVAWYDSVLAEEITDKAPVDDFVAGALAAAAMHSMGGSWRVVETRCRATGAPHCLFHGTRST